MTEIYFSKIWNYPLFNMGNNNIMVSNLVIALLMLWIGMRYYKILVSKLQLLISDSLKDDHATALVLQRIVTYMMVFIYLVFVLDLVNIPISTFAFLGGTIALSVGLGAQTLMGNFLSGLLVVIEKSLKTGDAVEIDGVVGIVKSIGTRSTIIRTFSGSEIVIPNSNFIHSIFGKIKTYKNLVETKASINIAMDHKDDSRIRKDIIEAIESIDSISKTPKPSLYLVEINKKNHLYSVCFYPKIIEQYHAEYGQDQINNAIKDRLSKYEFSISYPYHFNIKKEK